MDERDKIEIERFAGIVSRYCAWAEKPLANATAEMETARLLLAELHSVIFLPDVETEDKVKLDGIISDEWSNTYKRFTALPVDVFWLVFDPIEAKEGETVSATVADGLSDIYRDTKRGLHYFEAGYLAEAAWEWKFHFKLHWGWHLLETQKVIHFWFFHNEDDL